MISESREKGIGQQKANEHSGPTAWEEAVGPECFRQIIVGKYLSNDAGFSQP